jgi:assimilatory nitrate reductase catalytic subunit
MSMGAPTRTTCAYCGVGCGVLAAPQTDGTVTIKGDPQHPANFGRLCSKGSALGETLGHEQRLLYPQIGSARASWSDAIDLVARKFSDAIRDHGPDSVAFYVSGQLLTEDYYAANKLMKGFIGSANIDTNSRLCMSSAVAGQKRAFGADVVPCNYTDLEDADLIVLVGSNLAWCHPVLFQRLLVAKERRGTKLVVIDPRRTVTADAADLHLGLRPGSDIALFNGLLADLYRRGAFDSRYVFKHTAGLAEAMLAANAVTLEDVAAQTGLDAALIRSFYDLFARTPKTVTAFSMGVNQSSTGTDKVNAIINCHLLTGRIGKPGAGPFSITGQPNAMGGREVGGLANMLAAHMELDNETHREAVQGFWQSPRIATTQGLKAVELFEAVHAGRIKALWIMATNPAVSLPDSTFVADALRNCPFIVLSDVTASTETAQHAHVLLPAAGWGEKDGTVTNSERRISRQRAFLPAAGEARPDWRIICDVAKAMQFNGFDYKSPVEIFREYAALTTIGNDGTRRLDLSHWCGLSDAQYDAMMPAQWGGERPFSDGGFETPDGRARFLPTPYTPPDATGYRLNTGRIRDQWHTMTRTGLSPRLFNHLAEPFVEINPEDAAQLGLANAGLAEVAGEHGRSILRVLVSDRMSRGQLFQPMHWSKPYAAEAIANAATRRRVDPVSGQPDFKLAPVRVRRFEASWYGFGITISTHGLPFPYWARTPLQFGCAFECAGIDARMNWALQVDALLGADLQRDDLPVFEDRASGMFSAALFREGVFLGAYFAGPAPVEVSRSWIIGQIGTVPASRQQILAGRPVSAGEDQGPLICICMAVGRSKIQQAAAGGMAFEKLCQTTGAGTNCGSCRPEIMKILDGFRPAVIAAE